MGKKSTTEKPKRAELARILGEQEAIAAELKCQIMQLSEDLARKESALGTAEAARVATEQRLADRFDEIARLTTILATEVERASEAAMHLAWIREVFQVNESFPRWWALMPAEWRRKREHQRYQRRKLFNPDQYLEIYPDVAAHAMDPVRHYILHGMTEGRKRTH